MNIVNKNKWELNHFLHTLNRYIHDAFKHHKASDSVTFTLHLPVISYLTLTFSLQ